VGKKSRRSLVTKRDQRLIKNQRQNGIQGRGKEEMSGGPSAKAKGGEISAGSETCKDSPLKKE